MSDEELQGVEDRALEDNGPFPAEALRLVAEARRLRALPSPESLVRAALEAAAGVARSAGLSAEPLCASIRDEIRSLDVAAIIASVTP